MNFDTFLERVETSDMSGWVKREHRPRPRNGLKIED